MFTGPNIIKDGLILNLDAANVKSFRGEPTSNLLTNINYQLGTTDTPLFKINYGSETVKIPKLEGTRVAHYCNIYNDYIGGSGACCLGVFGFGSFSVLPNTVYTYQIIYKTSTGYNHPNYMYHYQYNSGTYVTEYGLHSTSRMEDLGNGWVHAWGTFTTNPSTNTFITYLFHYEYGIQNKVQVAGIMLSQGSTIHEPKFILPVNTTRGTTVATGGGLSDLSGKQNKGEIVNGLKYSSNNQGTLVFDGVNDVVVLGPSTNFLSKYHTYEVWVKTSGLGGNTQSGIFGISYGFTINLLSGGALNYLIYSNESSSYVVSDTTTGVNLFDNKWHHIVCTRGVSNYAIYVDGVLNRTGSGGSWTGTNIWAGMNAQIGNNPNNVNLFYYGEMAGIKIYNRALSTEEVQQNYNTTKTRFGL
jgi:hypothetical protein